MTLVFLRKKAIDKTFKKVTYKNVRNWRFLPIFHFFPNRFAIFTAVENINNQTLNGDI